MWLQYWKSYNSSSFSTFQWVLGILCIDSTLQSRASRGRRCWARVHAILCWGFCAVMMPFQTVSGIVPRGVRGALHTPPCWRAVLASLPGSFAGVALPGNIPALAWNPCLSWEVWGLSATERLDTFLVLMSDERLFLPSCVSLKCLTSGALIMGMGLFLSTLTSQVLIDHCWFSAEIWLDPASARHPMVIGLGYLFWSSQRQKGVHKHLARSTAAGGLWNR